MGGAVSSGESNDDLIDNLKNGDYIKTPFVETVFRAVDRGFYFTREYRQNAYKDLAWKDGNLHISAPCIYSEVMENLKIKVGMSFLNIGSGTGYLSTIVGLILGKNGINHGIEIHGDVVDYARAKLDAFQKSSAAIDMFDFCAPEFVVGNCLDTLPTCQRYDRIYCGAACAKDDVRFIVDLLKIGGICIIPMNDNLVQITRSTESRVETKILLPVSFASLLPRMDDIKKSVSLPSWNPLKLNELCRAEIREILRRTIDTPMPPGQIFDGSEEIRKRRRKKQNDRRRANRLLLVQRRRAGEGRATRSNGFMAIAYSVGGHSSSDEENESGRCRSPCNHNNCSNNRLKNESESTIRDSGTESGVDQKMEIESSAEKVVEYSREVSPTRRSHPTDSGASETVDRVLVNSSSSGEGPPPARRPRTETILERIREIIRHRQMEREAQRVNGQGLMGEAAALQPSAESENGADFVSLNNDEVDHECVWSSDESSSSTTTDSDSDGGVPVAEIQAGEVVPGLPSPRIVPEIGLAVRRIRSANIDSSDDGMDGPSESATIENIENGKSNIELEIEAMKELLNEPMSHPISVEFFKKINELNLPTAIKKFLNYERHL